MPTPCRGVAQLVAHYVRDVGAGSSSLLTPTIFLISICESAFSLYNVLMKKSQQDLVTVMIEVPKGSRNKYEFDKNTNRMKYDRMLFSAVHYPSDYGFIPDTLALDGDALDAMVLLWEPTFPGCFIEARPVGVFVMWDEKGKDEKVLCVPTKDPQWSHIKTLKEVPPHLLKEIEHFFTVYKDLEQKKTKIEGWRDQKFALKVIEQAKKRYANIR